MRGCLRCNQIGGEIGTGGGQRTIIPSGLQLEVGGEGQVFLLHCEQVDVLNFYQLRRMNDTAQDSP